MKRPCKTVGAIVACCGILVILSMVLPTSFWWFMLGLFLFCTGIAIMRR